MVLLVVGLDVVFFGLAVAGVTRFQVPHPFDWNPLSLALIVTTAAPSASSLAMMSSMPENPLSRAQ